jgi:CheY-like chemotaxis protein
LSRTFVEAQGGTLTCQNVGNGVAFLIEIPIVDAQGALGTIEEPARDERGNFAQEVAGVLVGSGPTLAAPPRVAARTVRVHVVDDNPLVRLMWTRSLGEYCVVYKSPECFLDAVDRDEVDKSDVVVADLDFGTSSKLSGLTILERLMATMPTVRRLLSTSLPAGVQESHQAVELVLPKTAFGVVVVRNNFLSNASLSSCEKPT